MEGGPFSQSVPEDVDTSSSLTDSREADDEGFSFISDFSLPFCAMAYGSDENGLDSSSSSSVHRETLTTSLHWFRMNALRLHDNPALLAALEEPLTRFRGVFIIDPWFASDDTINRWRFLLEALHDLDLQLQDLNLRLYVVQGQTTSVIDKLSREWNVSHLTYQVSPEPGSKMEETSVDQVAKGFGITIKKFHSHTLYNPEEVFLANDSKPVITFKGFKSLLPKLGPPSLPLLPPTIASVTQEDKTLLHVSRKYHVPTLKELGFPRAELYTNLWVGGERQALCQLSKYVTVRTTPLSGADMLLDRSSLSPYIRFGCLSVRYFWKYMKHVAEIDHQKQDLMKEVTCKLLQRELFLLAAAQIPNFDCSFNNPICLPLPWNEDKDMLAKWVHGRTGYPWIDAAMTQMHREGWMHNHLRQSVATFLTRGDLWINWVHGKDTFEKYMLDFEPSLSCGCWMRSAACAFVTGPVEHYCPISYGQKIDKEGKYIREYIPELREFPSKFIYAPWTAPMEVQLQCKCVIGIDYPYPVVDHLTTGIICMERIKEFVTMTMTSIYNSSDTS